MTIPADDCVFDPGVDDGVRRPTLDDVGSAVLQDAPGDAAPPKDGSHLYADMVNQFARLLRAYGVVVPSAIVTVKFAGGTAPFVDRVQALGVSVDSTDFTIVDNGVGDTSIRWTGTSLPTPTCDPSGLTLHSAAATHTASAILTLNSPTPGTHDITVRTKVGATGAAADVPFTIQIN